MRDSATRRNPMPDRFLILRSEICYLAVRSDVALDTRAPIVWYSLKTNDLAKATRSHPEEPARQTSEVDITLDCIHGDEFAAQLFRGREPDRHERVRHADFVTDMAIPYLGEPLPFIDVSNVRFVPIGPTTGPAEPIGAARETAHRRLSELAARF